MISILLVLWTY